MLISKNKLRLYESADKKVKFPYKNVRTQNLCLDENRAIVTNGYYMIIVEGKTGETDDYPLIPGLGTPTTPKKTLINFKTAKKVLNAIPTRPSKPILNNAIICEDEKNISFGATDLDNSTIISQRKEKGGYPDYTAVLPKTLPDFSQIYTVDYLITCLKAVKKFGAEFCQIEMWKDEDEPIKITAQNGDEKITAILNSCD